MGAGRNHLSALPDGAPYVERAPDYIIDPRWLMAEMPPAAHPPFTYGNFPAVASIVAPASNKTAVESHVPPTS